MKRVWVYVCKHEPPPISSVPYKVVAITQNHFGTPYILYQNQSAKNFYIAKLVAHPVVTHKMDISLEEPKLFYVNSEEFIITDGEKVYLLYHVSDGTKITLFSKAGFRARYFKRPNSSRLVALCNGEAWLINVYSFFCSEEVVMIKAKDLQPGTQSVVEARNGTLVEFPQSELYGAGEDFVCTPENEVYEVSSDGVAHKRNDLTLEDRKLDVYFDCDGTCYTVKKDEEKITVRRGEDEVAALACSNPLGRCVIISGVRTLFVFTPNKEGVLTVTKR